MNYGTLADKKQLQNRSNIVVALAIAAAVGTYFLAHASAEQPLLAMPTLVLGFSIPILWFWGLIDYARSKGYSFIYGLLGFFGIIGLLILLVLQDKWVADQGIAAPPGPSNYMRPPSA